MTRSRSPIRLAPRDRYQSLGRRVRAALPYPELDFGEQQAMLVFVDECERLALAVRGGSVRRWRLPEQMARSIGAANNASRLCLLLLEKRSWSAALTAYRLGERPQSPHLARELREMERSQAAASTANQAAFLEHCRRTRYRPPGAEVARQSIARMRPAVTRRPAGDRVASHWWD